MKSILAFFLCPLLLWNASAQQKPGKVLQFDIHKILNARPVTTLTGKKLVPWSTGIDGNGFGDGYSTQSAAVLNGDKDAHALPDNPLIATACITRLTALQARVQLHLTSRKANTGTFTWL